MAKDAGRFPRAAILRRVRPSGMQFARVAICDTREDEHRARQVLRVRGWWRGAWCGACWALAPRPRPSAATRGRKSVTGEPPRRGWPDQAQTAEAPPGVFAGLCAAAVARGAALARRAGAATLRRRALFVSGRRREAAGVAGATGAAGAAKRRSRRVRGDGTAFRDRSRPVAGCGL